MLDKRRSKRLDVDMSLNISNLFKQDNILIGNIDAPIHVVNISKNGIGFESEALLPIGYYFNAKINLGNQESSLYTVVQIVRTEKQESSMYYGCEFIGLAPILDFIFEDFEKKLEENN
ncbi:MAG: PilZ domain-containing protein [Clostridiales bacterium]|nr:PilZ domain-containing protein [Clostridiales bacterium]